MVVMQQMPFDRKLSCCFVFLFHFLFTRHLEKKVIPYFFLQVPCPRIALLHLDTVEQLIFEPGIMKKN